MQHRGRCGSRLPWQRPNQRLRRSRRSAKSHSRSENRRLAKNHLLEKSQRLRRSHPSTIRELLEPSRPVRGSRRSTEDLHPERHLSGNDRRLRKSQLRAGTPGLIGALQVRAIRRLTGIPSRPGSPRLRANGLLAGSHRLKENHHSTGNQRRGKSAHSTRSGPVRRTRHSEENPRATRSLRVFKSQTANAASACLQESSAIWLPHIILRRYRAAHE